MECEGMSQQTDGFRSEHTIRRVTISALQAEDAGLKPLVGLHGHTCQRLQISGFLGVFFWMKNISIQRSGWIPGLKLVIWHHE